MTTHEHDHDREDNRTDNEHALEHRAELAESKLEYVNWGMKRLYQPDMLEELAEIHSWLAMILVCAMEQGADYCFGQFTDPIFDGICEFSADMMAGWLYDNGLAPEQQVGHDDSLLRGLSVSPFLH